MKKQASVPPINRILRRTLLLVWLLVGIGLVATTILTSRALYRWEIETVNSVLLAADRPAMLAVESLDKRRGQSLTDGLLRSKGIFRVTLVDDFGDVLGQSERPPPAISPLLRLAHLFWPETTATILHDIEIHDGRQARLIVDVVLGTSDSGLVEASLLVLITQAVLIAVVTALSMHLMTTMPLINGLRVLSGWVGDASRGRIPPLPSARDFRFAELHDNASFIQRIMTNLLQQRQNLSNSVRNLELQIGLNEKYIRIINQILASTQMMAVHLDANGQVTVYNRDGAILPFFDALSPAVFRNGAAAFIDQLTALDQVSLVTPAGDLRNDVETPYRLLMDIDVTLENGRIIQFMGLELGEGEHALMISDQTQARVFAQDNFQRQKLESLGVLTSGVAHDLNNILAIISGSVEMELKRDLDRDSLNNLKAAESALQHGASVVRSLLRFSSKTPEQIQTYMAHEIVEDLLFLIKGKIGGEITVTAALETPEVSVRVNRSSLANALLNLVINARDAIDGKGQIHIILREAQPTDDLPTDGRATDFVVFEVRDDGPGIREDIRLRIMDPFFTTKNRDKGTGLGLTLVYSVAQSYGGKLSFANQVGAGAAFMIALPKVRQAQPQEIVQSVEQPVASAPKGGRILLVEDESHLAMLTTRYLEAHGHKVTSASSLTTAKPILKSAEGFDVIVTDLHLGDGTGFDVASQLHELPDPPPIILVSGNLQYGAFEQPTSMFAASLEKPFALSQLQALILELMHNAPAAGKG